MAFLKKKKNVCKLDHFRSKQIFFATFRIKKPLDLHTLSGRTRTCKTSPKRNPTDAAGARAEGRCHFRQTVAMAEAGRASTTGKSDASHAYSSASASGPPAVGRPGAPIPGEAGRGASSLKPEPKQAKKNLFGAALILNCDNV